MVVGVVSTFKDKILLLKRYEGLNTTCRGHWSVVTGDVDDGESQFGAAKRELLEETLFECTNWNLIYRYCWFDERLNLKFYLYQHLLEDKLFPTIDFEHTDWKYVHKDNLDQIHPMDDLLRKNIKEYILI